MVLTARLQVTSLQTLRIGSYNVALEHCIQTWLKPYRSVITMSHLNTAYKYGANRAMREFDANPIGTLLSLPASERQLIRNIPPGKLGDLHQMVDAGKPHAARNFNRDPNLLSPEWHPGTADRRSLRNMMSGTYGAARRDPLAMRQPGTAMARARDVIADKAKPSSVQRLSNLLRGVK